MKKGKGKKIMIVLPVILLILAVVAAGGFAWLYFHGLSGMSRVGKAQPGQIRVACVGDSITYGHGIANWPENNYPAVLQKLLGEDYLVNNYGVSGRAVQTDSDQPYTALPHYRQSLDFQADILVFMMGSNDAKPENWHDAETFRAQLETLLDSYGDCRLILCTPATAFFLNGETTGTAGFEIQPRVVEQITEIVREVAEDRGCELLDIHALTGENPDWFRSDGIHPDQDGAAAIAKAVAEVITGA